MRGAITELQVIAGFFCFKEKYQKKMDSEKDMWFYNLKNSSSIKQNISANGLTCELPLCDLCQSDMPL